MLSWKSGEATDGERTYVERARIDMRFERIGEYDSTGDCQFVDKQPEQGLSFYRLVTRYADGSMAYHTTMAVNRKKACGVAL